MKIAVILIRGLTKVNQDVMDTLTMLNLGKKHTCVILEAKDSTLGMVRKVNDMVTYGTVNETSIKLLNEKRKSQVQNVFHLNPPRGGFERKGIKQSYTNGGALGDRGDKINDLIAKMV